VLAAPPEVGERPQLSAQATLRLASTLATRKADVPRACALVAAAGEGLPADDDRRRAELRALEIATCPVRRQR